MVLFFWCFGPIVLLFGPFWLLSPLVPYCWPVFSFGSCFLFVSFLFYLPVYRATHCSFLVGLLLLFWIVEAKAAHCRPYLPRMFSYPVLFCCRLHLPSLAPALLSYRVCQSCQSSLPSLAVGLDAPRERKSVTSSLLSLGLVTLALFSINRLSDSRLLLPRALFKPLPPVFSGPAAVGSGSQVLRLALFLLECYRWLLCLCHVHPACPVKTPRCFGALRVYLEVVCQ